MKPTTLITVAALAVACAGTRSTTGADSADRDLVADSVQTNGSLRLETRDMPMGPSTPAFDTVPKISGGAGAVSIARSQLGSLCRFAVTGSADTQGNKIGVHIVFTERLAMCTAEVRVLQYEATVTAAPGTYDVALIHERNGVVDTLARQVVTVR